MTARELYNKAWDAMSQELDRLFAEADRQYEKDGAVDIELLQDIEMLEWEMRTLQNAY